MAKTAARLSHEADVASDVIPAQGDDGTFAEVHLTWAQHPEPGSWPVTHRLRGFPPVEAAIESHNH